MHQASRFTPGDLWQWLRVPNLFIVALVQYLLEYRVLLTRFERAGVAPILDTFHFSLLVGSTLLIAMGGYLINDIEDRHIDHINRPDTVVVGRKVSVRKAWLLYGLLFGIGFGISWYLALYVGQLRLLLIYPAAWVALFAYSKWLKRTVLWGNVLVSLFCALVAGIVWFAERAAVEATGSAGSELRSVFYIYLAFAFISTLFREIVKDVEDARGDAAQGARTLPVRYGEKAARHVAFAVLALFQTGVLFMGFYFYRNGWQPALLYTLIAVQLPLTVAFVRLWRAQTIRQWHRLSTFAKLLMLSGILLLLFF